MTRSATANWQGTGKEGKGSLTTQSNILNKSQYSFGTRFENGAGTNPEELIAAAHAGCFTMALAAELGKAGLKPMALHSEATVSLEQEKDQENSQWTINRISLLVTGQVPTA